MKKLIDMTNTELLELQEQLCNDPKNKNPEGMLRIYNKKTQKKLEEIRYWIVANSILANQDDICVTRIVDLGDNNE